MSAVLKFVTDMLTERDGVSWCLGRVIGFAAGVSAVYRFWTAPTLDFQSFGVCVAAIIAAVAAKNYSERG